MQTLTFARNIQEITKQLRVSDLIVRLETILQSTDPVEITEEIRDDFASVIFEAREGLHSIEMNPELRTLVQSLGLDVIFQSKNLAHAITVINTIKTNSELFTSPSNAHIFHYLLSSIKSLASFSLTIEEKILLPRLSPRIETERLIEIEIVDYDGNGLSVRRLGAILESLHKIHSLTVRVGDDKNSKLSISAMDSGEDFILSIQTGTKTAELMKTLFLQFWQKIRFRSSDEIDKSNDNLSKGLNIFQHISRQEKNGIFDSDQGNKLRNALLDEMIIITGLGVMIKDHEPEEKFDRRKLLIEKKDLRPEQTVLSAK